MTYANTRREIRRNRALYRMRDIEAWTCSLATNALVLRWEPESWHVLKGTLLHLEWEKKFQ